MVTLVKNILDEHKTAIKSIELIPSTGGVFDISINDELIFSRKQIQDRMPKEHEIEDIIKSRL